MVDVSSSEYSASSDSESEEENLASQKTSCDRVERNKPAKRNVPRLRRPHSLERKAKLAIFFTVCGLLKRNMTFRRKKPF